MGTYRANFSFLLRSFRCGCQSSVSVLFLLLLISLTGTAEKAIELNDVPEQKPQQGREALQPLLSQSQPLEDREDSQLPYAFNELSQSAKTELTKSPDPIASEDEMQEMHVLSRRDVSVEKERTGRQFRQQSNEFDRLYLCIVSFFTNPNCNRNGQGHQGQGFHSSSDYNGNSFNYNPNHYANGNAGNTHAFSPFVPTSNQQRFGLFGLGNNGIFGGRLGMSPQTTFTSSYPFFLPSTPQQQYPSAPQIPFHQTPYPEQQVNRRPGPPPSTIKTTTTTRRTTPVTTITTTAKPTTSTSRRTTKKPISFTPPEPETIRKNATEDCLNNTVPASTTQFNLHTRPTSSSSTWSKPVSVTFTPLTTTTTANPRETSVIKKLSDENAALKGDLHQAVKDVEDFKQQNLFLQEAVSALQSEGGRLKSRIAQLERTNDHLQQQNGQLQHTVADQKVMMNEVRSKAKYSEDKLVRLARQGLEDQKQITRLQNRVRDLNKENADCKNSVYQLQIQHTKNYNFEKRQGQLQDGRDELSTEQEQDAGNKTELPQIIEFDETPTTSVPETLEDDFEVRTLVPEEIQNQTETPTSNGTSPVTVTETPSSTTTTTQISSTMTTPTTAKPVTLQPLEPSEAETGPKVFEALFTMDGGGHPVQIFHHGGDGGPSYAGTLVTEDGMSDDSNEMSIVIGDPDMERTFEHGVLPSGDFYNHNNWPYHQFSQNANNNNNYFRMSGKK